MSISKNQTTYMIGTSHSIDEGDGSETVTIKTSSRFHKLCGVYSNSLFYVKFKSEFFYKWTIGYHTKFRRQRNDTRRRVFTSSIIPRIRHFHVVVGLASPQTSSGVRLSRIQFSPTDTWGRNECVTNEPQRTSAGRLWSGRKGKEI